MTKKNLAEESLLNELSILTAELDRLMKLSKDADTSEEAHNSLNNMSDIPNTQITTVFPLYYFDHEGEEIIDAHGELVVLWTHGVEDDNPILIEVSLVKSTRSNVVEILVTKDNPETASVWEYANSRVMHVIESGEYRPHTE